MKFVITQSALLAIVALSSIAASPRETLSRARELYNSAQYGAAIEAARTVSATPELADAAQLVLARAYLERFRVTDGAADLVAARDALRQVHAPGLGTDDRVELLVALGESLYLDGQPGAAAEQFDLALARADRKQALRRERLLDWWAISLDRQAQLAPEATARALQTRIVRRMEDELRGDAGATVASYWLAAGARGMGDIERAWDAAIAGWVRASQLGAKGVAVRDALDRLVTQAIIPDRARLIAPVSPDATAALMRSQWEALKRAWRT